MDSGHEDKNINVADAEQTSASQQENDAMAVSRDQAASTQAVAPTSMAGHKRARSAENGERGAEKLLSDTRLVLFHVNALLDCKEAMVNGMRAVIAEVFAARENLREIKDEDIFTGMCSTPIMEMTLGQLGIRDITAEESVRLNATFYRNFNEQTSRHLKLAEGAADLIGELEQQEDLKIAVLSHNPTATRGVLTRLGMATLAAKTIPSTSWQAYAAGPAAYSHFWEHWQKVVLPWYSAAVSGINPMVTVAANGQTTSIKGTATADETNSADPGKVTDGTNGAKRITRHKPLDPKQTLVVSCALYDLGLAKLTGMQTCWVKTPGLTEEAIANAAQMFDRTIDNLAELRAALAAARTPATTSGGGGGDSESEGSADRDQHKRAHEEGRDGPAEAAAEDEREDSPMLPPVPHSTPVTVASDGGAEPEVIVLD